MEEKKTCKTELAEVYIEDGLFHIFMISTDPTIAQYRKHFTAIKAHFGPVFPLPAILRNPESSKSPSKEMRDFLAGEEANEILWALAIINASSIIRLTINLFLKISKPSYPMQMFGDVKKADVWLRGLSK